jgi:hypothetical protein
MKTHRVFFARMILLYNFTPANSGNMARKGSKRKSRDDSADAAAPPFPEALDASTASAAGNRNARPAPAGPTEPEASLLIHAACIMQGMTGGIEAELAGYPAEAPKFVDPYPFHAGANRGAPDWESRWWQLPLITIGDPLGNGVLARASVCWTQTDTLWVSFRPLMLDAASMPSGLQAPRCAYGLFVGRHVPTDQTGVSVANTVDIVRSILSDKADPATGMSAGYRDLVDGRAYPVHVDNALDGPDAPARLRLPGRFGDTHRATLAAAVARLVTANPGHFRRVAFTGYSMGSGLALCAAQAVAEALRRDEATRAVRVCCVQFAGTATGDGSQRAHLERLGVRAYYVALKNHLERFPLDPVTYMPVGTDWLPHVSGGGRHFEIDYAGGTLAASRGPDPGAKQRLAAKWLVMQRMFWCMVTGRDGNSDVAWSFAKIHLRGESMLSRVVINACLQDARLRQDWMLHVPCDYFTAEGVAAKWKICPTTVCDLARDGADHFACVPPKHDASAAAAVTGGGSANKIGGGSNDNNRAHGKRHEDQDQAGGGARPAKRPQKGGRR